MKNDNNSSEKQLATPVLEASNRPSRRPEFEESTEPEAGDTSAAKGSDSIPFFGDTYLIGGRGPCQQKEHKALQSATRRDRGTALRSRPRRPTGHPQIPLSHL